MDRGNYRRGGGGGNRGRGRGRGGGNSEQEQGRGGGRGGSQMGSYNQQPPFQPPQQWGNQPRASGPGQYQGRGAPYNQQGTGQHLTAGQNPGRGGTAWPRPPPQQQPQQHGSSGGGTAWTRPPPKQRQQDVSSGSGTAWIRAPPQQPQQHGGGGSCGNQLQRDVEPSRSGASNVRSRGAPSGSSPSQSSGPIHQMDRQPVKKMAVESQNPDYSHFVSLPLAIYPELVNKLINFQNSVLGITEVSKSPTSESKASELFELGIEKSIFINPETFHLTVLILKLWNKDRFEAAAQVLRSVSPKVLDALENRPVSIRLKGLECMRGSPAKAYVVYAPVEVIGGEARLLRACRIHNFWHLLPSLYPLILISLHVSFLTEFTTCICHSLAFLEVMIDAFTEAGLVLEKDANRKLKLHATIMNARHSRRSGNADSFDARAIFGQYGSEEWGECLLREAHLSQRFVYGDNGYYHCCESIPFPEGM